MSNCLTFCWLAIVALCIRPIVSTSVNDLHLSLVIHCLQYGKKPIDIVARCVTRRMTDADIKTKQILQAAMNS